MSANKTTNNFPPQEKIDLFEKMVSAIPALARKGSTMPYTSVNGNMFSFIDKHGSCAIRLPEKEREDFLKKYKTELFATHGAVLKEYVTVPDDILKKTKELMKWFEISYEYVRTMKPKTTKNKNKYLR